MWFKPVDGVNDVINLNLVTKIVVDPEPRGAPPRHMVFLHFTDKKRPMELMLTVPKVQELEFFLRKDNKIVTPPSDEPLTIFVLFKEEEEKIDERVQKVAEPPRTRKKTTKKRCATKKKA